MKIICRKNDLFSSINIVSKAVASKTTMDILECILIETDNDRVRLTANDTEIGIETYFDAEVMEEGQIALEARMFSDMIKRLPDSDVSIETFDNMKTEIHCEKIHFDIQGKSGEDFTRLPEIEHHHEITLSQFDIKEMIRQTLFSVSSNENNKLMTGEQIKIEDNTLMITSLDGHRISLRRMALQEECADIEVIVPGKTMSELLKILPGEAKDLVTLCFSDKHILFRFGDTRIVSRLLDGKFYNINQIISTDYEIKLTVNKMDFIRSLDRSTLFVKESDRKPIMMQTHGNLVDISIHSQMGAMDDQLMGQKEGKDITIGLNPRFMLDALRAIDDESVTMYFINDVAPCIIRNDSETYLYIVLPIMIRKNI